MNCSFRLVLFILWVVTGCQNVPETPPPIRNWTGNWIDDGIRQGILKNETFLAAPTLPMELIFTPRTDSVFVQNGTFEAGVISFRTLKPNQRAVHLFDAEKPTILTLEDDHHLSFHNHRTGTDHTFVRITGAITDKQTGAVMPNFFLEQLLKGQYRVSGQYKDEPNTDPVFTIHANGRAEGLGATHVQLVIGGDLAATDIDVISLISISKRQVRHFGWRKDGSKLLLYYLVNAAGKDEKPEYKAGKAAFVLDRIGE
ncbi:MAG TPA: hypothetical protein PLL64_11510 [Rhodothermales bacterium]|nr:hypothetical protein [Rhodothermales bacterium]HRR09571.1 hypothetical protein [Rhodothermales bacterium]